MHSPDNRIRLLVLSGILTGLALALSLIDSSVSSLLAFLPGFRLGLANIVSLFALYFMGLPWALLICAARCILGAVFAGQMTMFLFSIFGGVGSLLIMRLAKNHLSLLKVSMCGGVTHNLLQLVTSAVLTATAAIFSYLPILLVLGTTTGFLMGWICALVFRRLPERYIFPSAKEN